MRMKLCRKGGEWRGDEEYDQNIFYIFLIKQKELVFDCLHAYVCAIHSCLIPAEAR